VPLAIIFHFRLPESGSWIIYGASAWTEKRLSMHLNRFVDNNIHNVQYFQLEPRDWLTAHDIENLAIGGRMVLCDLGKEANYGWEGKVHWHL